MIKKFTAVYFKRGKWYIGYVEEIPGVNSQGKTLAETKENLKEAFLLILKSNHKVVSMKKVNKLFSKSNLNKKDIKKHAVRIRKNVLRKYRA